VQGRNIILHSGRKGNYFSEKLTNKKSK